MDADTPTTNNNNTDMSTAFDSTTHVDDYLATLIHAKFHADREVLCLRMMVADLQDEDAEFWDLGERVGALDALTQGESETEREINRLREAIAYLEDEEGAEYDDVVAELNRYVGELVMDKLRADEEVLRLRYVVAELREWRGAIRAAAANAAEGEVGEGMDVDDYEGDADDEDSVGVAHYDHTLRHRVARPEASASAEQTLTMSKVLAIDVPPIFPDESFMVVTPNITDMLVLERDPARDALRIHMVPEGWQVESIEDLWEQEEVKNSGV